MNARPIDHYTAAQLEADRAAQIDAQLQVDALLDRIRQHDTGGCHAPSDTTPAWLFWACACGYSLLLTFASYEFATRVLPVLRGWLP